MKDDSVPWSFQTNILYNQHRWQDGHGEERVEAATALSRLAKGNPTGQFVPWLHAPCYHVTTGVLWWGRILRGMRMIL